jgi:hypothetical protein
MHDCPHELTLAMHDDGTVQLAASLASPPPPPSPDADPSRNLSKS